MPHGYPSLSAKQPTACAFITVLPVGYAIYLNEKKAKDRTGQSKSHKVVTFRLFGEKPPIRHCTDWKQNLHGGQTRRRNHVCKVSRWYFRGYDFTGGRISHFPTDLCTGLTTVQRCLWGCDCSRPGSSSCCCLQDSPRDTACNCTALCA